MCLPASACRQGLKPGTLSVVFVLPAAAHLGGVSPATVLYPQCISAASVAGWILKNASLLFLSLHPRFPHSQWMFRALRSFNSRVGQGSVGCQHRCGLVFACSVLGQAPVPWQDQLSPGRILAARAAGTQGPCGSRASPRGAGCRLHRPHSLPDLGTPIFAGGMDGWTD